MKSYVKPVLIALFGIFVFSAGVILVMNLYNKYLESIKVVEVEEYQEVQIDFNTIYKDADNDHIVTIYNGQTIENHNPVRYIGDYLYFPIDIVTDYLNDQFFYDPAEGTITYTTQNDIIRMKTDELTYTVNDEPLKLDIGVTVFDDVAYLPLSLVQKFTHHDFVYSEKYHVLQISDWYASVTTGEVYSESEDVYVRNIPQAETPYIHKAFNGMEVMIVDEDGDYYQVLTKEGFLGYIKKEFVRSVVTTYSDKEPVQSYKEFAASDFDGKLTMVWNYVNSQNTNLKIKSYMENTKDVDVISPTWFTLEGTDGKVKSYADLNYVRWAHDNGYQVWALLHNLDEGYTRAMTHDVISSTQKRAEVIRQVMALAAVYELDGINIDFEAIPEADGEYYVQFCKEMAVYAKQEGLTISADFPVIKSWTRHYNRQDLSKYLDYIIVMAYDEHWGSSPIAGSVASKTWTDEGIYDTMQEVPKEKIIIGIPFYTRLWMEEEVDGDIKVSSKAFGMDYAKNYMDEKGVQWEWLDDIGQYYAEYSEDNIRYRMWLESIESVKMRMEIAADYDIGGVAGWRIGFENDGIWEIISKYMKPDKI